MGIYKIGSSKIYYYLYQTYNERKAVTTNQFGKSVKILEKSLDKDDNLIKYNAIKNELGKNLRPRYKRYWY